MTYPTCFPTQKLFDEWKELARLTHVGQIGICIDCTAVYQAEQLAAGNCKHPEIKFGVDKDGWECGFLPSKTPGYVNKALRRK